MKRHWVLLTFFPFAAKALGKTKDDQTIQFYLIVIAGFLLILGTEEGFKRAKRYLTNRKRQVTIQSSDESQSPEEPLEHASV